MKAVILTSENKTDFKLIIDLAKKIGIKAKELNEDDLEDLGLLKAMEEGRKTKFVSNNEKTPNETTIRAMKEVNSKNLKRYKNVKDLMKDLNS